MLASQSRMARAALGWGVPDLARAAKASPHTIARLSPAAPAFAGPAVSHRRDASAVRHPSAPRVSRPPHRADADRLPCPPAAAGRPGRIFAGVSAEVSLFIYRLQSNFKEQFRVSIPSNGITAEVIREVMPHYHLNTDLLGDTLRVLPPPPADASTPWRHARIKRLVQEIGGLMPADAPQARIAAQIVIVRGTADDSFLRSNAPGLTIEQVCQLRRIADNLARTALAAERTLTRRQSKPAPFFGTVEADAVDIAALDAGWRNEPGNECPTRPAPIEPRPNGQAAPDPRPAPENQAPPAHGAGPNPTPDQPGAAPPMQDAAPSPAAIPTVAGAPPALPPTRPDPEPGYTRDVPPTTGREAASDAAPARTPR